VLDPEIQSIVDAVEAGRPAHLVPLDDLRTAQTVEALRLAGPGEEVAEVCEVDIPGPAGSVPVRVYRPKPDTKGPLPVVAYAHGGGWVMGTLDGFDTTCRALANAAGALIASIDYRLAPEHPFPAGLEDVLAVVRRLGEDAGELGGDPERLAVGGDSAGANLVAVAARRLRDEGGPDLRLQALIYPVCDSGCDTGSYREKAVGFGLSAASMERYWKLYLDGADGRQPDASPLRVADLAGLPPAFVLTVPDDVLRDEGEAYARKLIAAGVRTTAVRYNGIHHDFMMLNPLRGTAAATAAVEQAIHVLRKALGQ
jgi:acetyl esterase